MIAGSIPFRTFKERIHIVNRLKSKYGKYIKITIEDNLIIFQINQKIKDHQPFIDKYCEIV